MDWIDWIAIGFVLIGIQYLVLINQVSKVQKQLDDLVKLLMRLEARD